MLSAQLLEKLDWQIATLTSKMSQQLQDEVIWPCKLSISVLLLDTNNHCLLLRKKSTGQRVLPWWWVETAWDSWDTTTRGDVISSAVREVKEESGIDITPNDIIDVLSPFVFQSRSWTSFKITLVAQRYEYLTPTLGIQDEMDSSQCIPLVLISDSDAMLLGMTLSTQKSINKYVSRKNHRDRLK